MHLNIHPTAAVANAAAANLLSEWLSEPGIRSIMVAAGNSPLDLYHLVSRRQLTLSHLTVYALDEYVGVPLDELRNCANLLRRTVVSPWGIPASQYFFVSSSESDAQESIRRHEQRIADAGGLDIVVLGLGQNGHLGFNEPGSAPDSPGRVLELDRISIEANRTWFDGDYAPAKGVTAGLKTILGARRIMILAYGPHKTSAVHAMVSGPVDDHCPASFLQSHPHVHAFLDREAARTLNISDQH
jgi:glucosamine-6-phosphate deaminase